MATLIAWADSGAGRMPSVRANWTPASKLARWWTAHGLDEALLLEQADTSGDMPW